jgi:hypothetical protein
MTTTREPISISHLPDDITCHIVTAAALSMRDEKSDIYQRFEVAACKIVRNVRAYSVRGISDATWCRGLQESEGCTVMKPKFVCFIEKLIIYLAHFLASPDESLHLAIMSCDAKANPRFAIATRIPATAACRSQNVIIFLLVAPNIFLNARKFRGRNSFFR